MSMSLKTHAISAAAIAGILSWSIVTTTAQRGQGAGDQPQGGAAAQGGRGGRGQRGPQLPPAGPAPRLPNGKPDLSGHWGEPYTPNMAGRGGVLDPQTRQPLVFARQGEMVAPASPDGAAARTFDLPYTEWGLKKWKDYDPVRDGEYTASCLPFGMSRNVNSPHGVQVIQNNDAVAFLWEQNNWFTFVPTNGMKWPEDLPRAWTGMSTGRWDGDTLIVETTGFNGYTRLDTVGHPHSKDAKMINTFLRTDSNTIQHTVTIHDPKTFTQDWMNVRTWRIKPANDVIMEYACEENNLENLFNGVIKPWKAPDNVDD